MLAWILLCGASYAAEDTVEVVPYGTIKPTFVVAKGAVDSFGQPNLSAVNAAGNPALDLDPDALRMSFQAVQSRFGLKVAGKGPVKAKVEVDFLDVTKASPTAQANPRLRVASVEWKAGAATTVQAGQDWDIHAPVNPHHTNMVGTFFQAGNTGFLRPQVGVRQSVGALELAVSASLPSPNPKPTLGSAELAGRPAVSARVAWRDDKKGMAGVGVFSAPIRFDEDHSTHAYSANAFADLTLQGTSLRAEVYYGQDLASVGALGLGSARLDGDDIVDIPELGGFASVRQRAGEHHAVWAGAGLAKVSEASDVLPAYTPGVDGAAGTYTGLTGAGITQNLHARAGYGYLPTPALTVFAEGFALQTTHALDATDASVDPTRFTPGGELGLMYSF